MAKNPSEMTDEELDEAIANPPQEGLIPPVEVIIEPEKPDDSKAKKPKEEQVEEPVKPVKTEDKEEEEEEEEKPPSRRETLRIQQVLAKLKEQTPAPAPVAPAAGLDYKTAIDAEPEVIEKLETDRKAVSDAAYKQGVDQANSIRFHTRLEIDAPKMEAKYPELDKGSDKFKPALADAINNMYLSAVGFNRQTGDVKDPNIRYSDYVEGIFELADEIAGEKTEKSKTEITKQAANTGLRPDGSTVKRLNLNKLPEQMTDEELDARIALAIPSK